MIWRNLGLILLFLLTCFILTLIWLRIYTHHGQSYELPDYTGTFISESQKDASKRSFEIKVVDSIFMVGKEGGIIINQNPEGGSMVKKRRKIYVTITKEEADKIPLRRLPILYGKSFDRKRKELKQGFEINATVSGKRYDPGPPDHILSVIYQGDTIINAQKRKDNVVIEKGGTLEMILSKNTGGTFYLPDVTCKLYEEALFQLQTLNLVVTDPLTDETVRDVENAFVYKQYPEANAQIIMGDTINLYLTKDQPIGCDE